MDDSDCSSCSSRLNFLPKTFPARLIAITIVLAVVGGCDVAPPKEYRFSDQTVTYVNR